MEGWIKIHRKILENPIICKDSDYLAVWIYLLLNATHKEMPVLFKGKKIILQKGQLITGRKSIANQLKISESKIFRIINCFKSEHQIEQQVSNKNSVITILNWDKYQQLEQQNEAQMNNKRTTSEQQVNTNKNVKNVKNDKNERNNNIYNNIINIYNEYCSNLSQVQKLTDKRKTAINKLLKTITEEQFKEICIIANNSDFLIGDNDRNWKADFDFIIKVDKAVSILEGKYNNKKRDKIDGFIDLWKEAQEKDEKDGNGANNNSFSW